MRTGRVPNALPPLLQHYADALEHLRTADPQASRRFPADSNRETSLVRARP